jgi:hypothetical protein
MQEWADTVGDFLSKSQPTSVEMTYGRRRIEKEAG